jgi:single-strand DNA-binding protein
MTNDLILTITGNLTADPELNHSRDGTPIATLIVATTPRHYDRAADMWADEETIYLRCTAWRHTAQNIAASLRKGDPVLAHGKLRQHTHTTDTGRRSALELDIDDIGRSLRHRTAQTGPGSQHNGRRHTVPARPHLTYPHPRRLSTAVRAAIHSRPRGTRASPRC